MWYPGRNGISSLDKMVAALLTSKLVSVIITSSSITTHPNSWYNYGGQSECTVWFGRIQTSLPKPSAYSTRPPYFIIAYGIVPVPGVANGISSPGTLVSALLKTFGSETSNWPCSKSRGAWPISESVWPGIWVKVPQEMGQHDSESELKNPIFETKSLSTPHWNGSDPWESGLLMTHEFLQNVGKSG